MKYLVKFRPLEPYAFGTDQSFKYKGVSNMAKETYFVRSKKLPEQTTILGALRYLFLQNKGLLRTDFNYTQEERMQMNALIGAESFSFERKSKQEFGVLHRISPVFLIDTDNHPLVKNPFHNTSSEAKYQPMEIEEKEYHTSAGILKLPAKGEYHAKKGYAGGYYNLSNGKIIPDDKIFDSKIFTGNRKNSEEQKDEDGYFKREVYTLNDHYQFAVYVDAAYMPEKGIVFMGQKKSTFLVTAEETKDDNLEEQVQNAFREGPEWFYALSDLVVTEAPVYNSFCIVEQKKIQNLETVYSEKNHTKRLRKSPKQYNLIQSGSVFFSHCPINIDNENHKQIGYNYIVKIGGKQS